MPKLTYWLDWKSKLIKPSSQGLVEIPWQEIENHPLTVYCDQDTWPLIEREEKDKVIIADETKRTYQIGLATIKELRGATEDKREPLGTQALKKCWELCPNFIKEHPSHDKETFERIGGWVFPPRFENLQQGTFTNIWKIDIKSCYANIMRDYPLPYGEPIHLKDHQEIEKALQEGKTGFVGFYLRKSGAVIKEGQIPFIPSYHLDISSQIKGRLLLHTRLFNAFNKHYEIKDGFYYNDFWIFNERKGDINPFLAYCKELKKIDEKQGKMLANAYYGAVGKSKFGGYNYRAWTLAVNHLAILQTYYLYRQFLPEKVLAIRSDCIYVTGELPPTILHQKDKYHLEHYEKVSFHGDSNIFIHDLNELKSFTSGEEREKLISEFKKNN